MRQMSTHGRHAFNDFQSLGNIYLHQGRRTDSRHLREKEHFVGHARTINGYIVVMATQSVRYGHADETPCGQGANLQIVNYVSSKRRKESRGGGIPLPESLFYRPI